MKGQESTNIVYKHFWCYDCHDYFKSSDFTEKDGNHYAPCPHCKKQTMAGHHALANIPKMCANATGPRTKEGKERSALNGYKTGIRAQKMGMLAPANYMKYTACLACEHAEQCKGKKIKYCPENMSRLLQVVQAYTEGDPKALQLLAAQNQAKTTMALDACFQYLFKEGATVTSEHKDFTEIKDNPVLKHIPKLMEVTGFTSDQQKMNPKEEGDTNSFESSLHLRVQNSGDFINQFQQTIETAFKNMVAANKNREADPVRQNMKKEESGDKAELELPETDPFK